MTINAKQHFLSIFEKQQNENTSLQSIHQEAMDVFSKQEFPTKRHEEWKYTNIKPITEKNFTLSQDKNITISSETIQKFLLGEEPKHLLVFINGFFCENLSQTSNLDNNNIIIDDLQTALDKHSDLLLPLIKSSMNNDEIFSSLNTALFENGTFIHVPANTVIEDTIFILNISHSSNEFLNNAKNVFFIGENSQLSLLETYQCMETEAYFNNVTTDVFVQPSANVEHIRLQQESSNAYNLMRLNIHQEKNSNYTSVNIDLGGAIARNNINVGLNNSNIESNLYGLYIGQGSQLIDNHTFIDHAKPHCNSNELYKGILDDNSKGVFNGKVLVRQDAQKTNAFQSNKNIVLSDNASIDTKPQLEIFADDVKCSHGATVGELDDSAMFYLRARGIGEKEAHALLRQAFIAEVLQYIKKESIREKIEEIILESF